MQTRVLAVDPDEPEPDVLDEAAAVLRGGGLVAFATETVYGLGAVATNPDAVQRIFRAKGRPSFNPLIVHVADIDHARRFAVEWTDRTEQFARTFWPGPLTLVVSKPQAIPDVVSAGGATVGLRVPVPRIARRLIECVGLPLAAPSANRSNRISPTRAEHVLHELDGLIELILDSGPTTVGLESTVLDVTSDPPRVLRPGPIGRAALEAAIGSPVITAETSAQGSAHKQLTSPGQLSVHYAPRTTAVRVAAPEHLTEIDWPPRAGLLTFQEVPLDATPPRVARITHLDSSSAGRGFYDALHALDSGGLDLIVAVEPPNTPEWDAIRDRLSRATVPHQKISRR